MNVLMNLGLTSLGIISVLPISVNTNPPSLLFVAYFLKHTIIGSVNPNKSTSGRLSHPRLISMLIVGY